MMSGCRRHPQRLGRRCFARQRHGWEDELQIIDADGSLLTAYGVGGLPSTVIVDSRGVVVDTILGGQSHQPGAAARLEVDSLA